MQACAVHLCHRTPRRCRVARVPRPQKLATRAHNQVPFMPGIFRIFLLDWRSDCAQCGLLPRLLFGEGGWFDEGADFFAIRCE